MDDDSYLEKMEGPSLYLAAIQLRPFQGKVIRQVSGNSTIGIERLEGQNIREIFSWGKHLVFQFDTFALRVHFMLFGSFEATVEGNSVTGDYKKKNRTPRLAFVLENGHIEMYSCSVRYIEEKRAKALYDFSVDVMSKKWDPEAALKKISSFPDEEIADVLLDQDIFAGVGNIIKNEILFFSGVPPQAPVKSLSKEKRKELIVRARKFSFQFYEWRKVFLLRKSLVMYRKSACPHCGSKVTRKSTGKRARLSYYCEGCQKS